MGEADRKGNKRQRRIGRRVRKYCKNCKKLNAYYKPKKLLYHE